MSDFRYALRTLGRSPGFTAVAVLTLALGIGANTAMFAVVNAVLLKPLPFSDADRLMLVHVRVPDPQAGPGAFGLTVWSYPKYAAFAKLQRTFDAAGLFAARDITLTHAAEAEALRGEVVAGAYFSALGIAPAAGRLPPRDDSRPDAQRVAVIGHGLWSRRFGADPGVVGRTIHLNAVPYTVAGVLPRGFRGLSGAADVWVPLAAFEPERLTQGGSHNYFLIGRRSAGVGEAAAVADVRVVGSRVDAQFGSGKWSAEAVSLYSSRVDPDIRRSAMVLLGAVGFVLLIACVNLTSLLFARAVARRREVAVRLAIGASRGRIARQFLAEALTIAGLGAGLGLALAATLLDLGSALLPESDVILRGGASSMRRIAGAAGLTRIGAGMIRLDAVTFLFTAGSAVVAAAIVGILPAFQASALRPIDALRASGTAAASGGARGQRVRALLVVAETALALVLLIGAGLMIKSFARLQGTPLGVISDHVLTVRLRLPEARYDAAQAGRFVEQLLERVRSLPGVSGSSVGNCAPVSGGCGSTIMAIGPGRTLEASDDVVGTVYATPDHVRTLGLRVLRGRAFTGQDGFNSPKVVLVNEAAARALWPNADPIGQTVLIGLNQFGKGAEVVGVVSNVRYRAIETPAQPDVYVSFLQAPRRDPLLFVRSQLDSRTLVAAIGREVRALDPGIPLTDVKTMAERIGDASWRTRVSAWLLSVFAAVALFLTALGIFGVLAQVVAQRTPEIGIRMALGAGTADVVRLVTSQALALTAAGLAIGLGLAFALARVLTTLLYDVKPDDTSTFAAVAFVLTLVALLASFIPARRATRIDPVTALRAE
jgi:putative ABC transport system permease protein